MPVRKQEAHRALELLEEYHCKLNKPQDKQLRNAIERVIRIFKSRLFQALLGSNDFPENINMLKKIIHRILYNQYFKQPKNINEFFINESEDLPNRYREETDNDETDSSGDDTSVLDLSPQNTSAETQCDREEIKSVVSVYFTPQTSPKHSRLELTNEKLDCNLYKKGIFNGDLAADFRAIDICGECKKNMCSSVVKPRPLPVYKDISDFNPHIACDMKCARNTSTQTDTEVSEQSHNSTIKCSMNTSSHSREQKEKKPLLSHKGADIPSNCSAFLPYNPRKLGDTCESVVYGSLFVVGCNGTIPPHLVGKLNTKYILRKRMKANGLKEAFSYVKSSDEIISASPARHIISYPMSKGRPVIVAFKHDTSTDMFQIGRHETQPVDFSVDDINPVKKARHGVSRFACRIIVHRDGNHEARLYAAAFDSSQAIFLGESSMTYSYQGHMDGFTTNGVLIMQPDGNYSGIWREVSISGFIYPLRSSKMEISKRPRLLDESNVLRDGTLIDLCGVTLIWRTPEGLKKTPNEEYLSRLVYTLHRSVPEYRLLSRDSNLLASKAKRATKKAYVFLSCGHVVGLTVSRLPDSGAKGWSCPVCGAIGPITEFTVGAEPGFYVDREFPSHAFKPCGHVASQKTVEYWSSIELPEHRIMQSSLCPFCGEKLNFITKYIRLTFPVP